MSDWISVKDKLPEDSQKVLVYLRSGDIYCGEFCKSHSFTCNVTHWQPLPPPPPPQPQPPDLFMEWWSSTVPPWEDTSDFRYVSGDEPVSTQAARVIWNAALEFGQPKQKD